MGRGVRAAVGLVAAVGLLGCGSADDADESTVATPVLTAAEIDWSGGELPDGWNTQPLSVESLRAVDEQTLAVDATVIRVRQEDGSCVGVVGGRSTDEGHPTVVWVDALMAAPGIYSDEAPEHVEEHGPCPEEAVAFEIDLPLPLGGRDLRVGNADLWAPAGGGNDVTGAYARCVLPACDPETGDPPTLASCEDQAALVDDVRTFGDVGQHASIVERRCADGWAMVDADIGAGACPPDERGSDDCAGQRVDRLFLRAGTPHWEVITRTREAGCGGVTAVEPEFPTDLCEDRPALGP